MSTRSAVVRGGQKLRRRGALGALAGAPAAAFALRAGTAGAAGEAVYFPETGHHLRSGFLAYWRSNEGPQRLGPPIAEEGWDGGVEAIVQHFTLGSLEWRGAAPGQPESVREGPGGGRATPAVAREAGVPDWRDALAPSQAQITLPPTVRQGRTLVVSLGADDPAAPLTFTGTGLDTPLRVYPTAGGGTRAKALVGIPVDAPLGPREVAVAVRNGLGLEAAPRTAAVQVVDGAFSVQRLAFQAELLDLIEPQVGDQERLTIAAVTSESAPAPLWRGRFRVPVAGRLVTSHGARRDYLDPARRVLQTSQHGGVDIAANMGVPIACTAAGVVAFTGTWAIRGNVVVVDHGAGVHSVYAHASQIVARPGQTVSQGEVLALIGSTGLSTGPHLHWEVRVRGVAVEPFEWTERDDLV